MRQKYGVRFVPAVKNVANVRKNVTSMMLRKTVFSTGFKVLYCFIKKVKEAAPPTRRVEYK
jgi:hypothetical protein